MEAPEQISVLVIDDDPDTRANLTDILELDDHRVEVAGSVAEALGRGDRTGLAAIILDRELPDGAADDLVPRLRRAAPEAAIIVVTGYDDLQGVVAALRHGAADYILKPLDADALRDSVRRVAERRWLALARRRSDAAFRNLVESAECLIMILRTDRSVLYLNPFAERLTGYRTEEIRCRDGFAVLLPDATSDDTSSSPTDEATGRVRRGELPIRCRDGSRRWVAWSFRPLEAYEGGPALLALGYDISAIKEAQERALRAERLAAIGEVATGLAHESRNALQRSQACLEMLALRVRDRPAERDLVERLQHAQDHLHRLFEDIRVFAAPIALDHSEFDLLGTLRAAWDDLEATRRDRDVVLRLRADAADATCIADHFRIIQVFRNILENALAASRDPAAIVVRCEATGLDGRSALRVAVRDNGPGLDPEQHHRIFEPFFTTKTRGTGLGMAIARRIVEAHGGRIDVGDSGGPGAEIVVTLPRRT